MDQPTLPPSPSILLKPKLNPPKILLVLIPLLIIAGLIGFIFIKHPFNLFQPKKNPLQIQESSPSAGGLRIYPKFNKIGFNGKVKEKGKDYLILMSGEKTIKVEINSEVEIRLINKEEFAKNSELSLAKQPKFIQLSDIKIGDSISLLGSGDSKLIKTLSIIIVFK